MDAPVFEARSEPRGQAKPSVSLKALKTLMKSQTLRLRSLTKLGYRPSPAVLVTKRRLKRRDLSVTLTARPKSTAKDKETAVTIIIPARTRERIPPIHFRSRSNKRACEILGLSARLDANGSGYMTQAEGKGFYDPSYDSLLLCFSLLNKASTYDVRNNIVGTNDWPTATLCEKSRGNFVGPSSVPPI